MTENAIFTRLPGRGLVRVEGPDRIPFLQNLVTNDVTGAAPGRAVYACLLTPQGKFLHDFFISGADDALLVECEGGPRAQDLCQRLNTYRLRADVKISVDESVPVYAVGRKSPATGYPDPRKGEMGWRTFVQPDLPEESFENWDTRRIRLCIPDGSRDMIPGQSALDEARLDTLNGVSYGKGCYVGQELTARMHYRGIGKKHLYTVRGNLPGPGHDILIDGKSIGQMRSSCGEIGLALLKDDQLPNLKFTGMELVAPRN